MRRIDIDALLNHINDLRKSHKKEVTTLKSKVTKLQNQLIKMEMSANSKPL